MPTVQLEIGALPAHVRTARLVAAALARRLGLEAVVIDEIKLAVGEACSRAVSVHRSAGVTNPIAVEFRDDDSILEIAVVDSGPSGAERPERADAFTEGITHEAAEQAAAELLSSATSRASGPAEVERGIDVASLAPGLGLALIAGLVDDITVSDRAGSPGTVVTMRWPIVSF